MTRRTELLALAARVEAATGADRELDFWIDVRITGTRHTDAELQADIDVVGIEGMIIPYAYTASLDAAMSLVPSGWAVESASYWPVPDEYRDDDNILPPAQYRLVGCSPKRWGRKTIYGHGSEDGRVDSRAATPALALTAACLRALAVLEQDNGRSLRY